MQPWPYDDATAGKYRKGRLSTMTDPSGGSRIFSYERRGLLTSELWSRGRFSYSPQASYGYDANGNRSSVTYPSGSVVQYTFDWADRPLTAGTTTNANFYAHDAQYAPFGPMTSLTYGNGTVRTYGLDANHRYLPSALSLTGSSQTVSYQYGTDAGGNITSIADSGNAAYNRTFAYDDLNRLTTANSGASLWGSGGFTYDAMGNMLTMSLGTSRSEAFTYSGTTPKIATVTENGAPAVSVSYDAAGNETAIGTTTFSYSTRNSLLSASTPSLTYTYDGRGLRAFTYGTWASVNPTRYFMYSAELRLLSEHDDVFGPQPPSGFANQSYIWFGGDLIAEIDHSTSATYWAFTDHLGTPLVLTDAGATVVWRAEYEPYGKIFAYRIGNSSFHQPVRLPGQEAEQYDTVGSDRYYNIFRWYRNGWGRYTQSDPIGIEGGINPYAYARQSPLDLIDPLGMKTCVIFTRDTFLGIPYYSHTAMWSSGSCTSGSKCQMSDPFLYDPAGSYRARERGSGGLLIGGDVSLDDYVRYQRSTGSSVEVYCFETSCCEEKQLADRANEIGDPRGFSCARSVSTCLSGVGPFRNVTSTGTRGACRTQILNARRRMQGNGGW